MNPIENGLKEPFPKMEERTDLTFHQLWQLVRQGYCWEGDKIRENGRRHEK